MALNRIGPVVVDHRNPVLRWTTPDDGSGLRGVTVSGQSTVASVQQLAELVFNADRRVTVGSRTGVLEYLDMDGALVGKRRGWYLLSSIDDSAERPWSVTEFTPFTISGAYLGTNGQVVVTRSARARTNTHSLTPRSVVADPFWAENPSGEPFTPVPSAGDLVVRDYDPTAPHVATLTPPLGSRSLTLYLGALTGGSDQLPPVVVPAPRLTDASWVANRGGDVRVYDKGLSREAYNRDHDFAAVSDILVTNGLLRFTVGPRSSIPYVTVEAFAQGTWRPEGSLAFSAVSSEVLLGARLSRVTPDVTTVVLTCRVIGEVFLTLRRGERMIQVHHGSDRPPFATATRSVRWLGSPPDTGTEPNGSALANGRRFHATTEGGSTRTTDGFGLTKGLGALTAVTAMSKFGLTATAVAHLDVAAFLATTSTHDDLADHHNQFAAASEQEVRVRL